jgi:hypothetical protein
VSLVLKRNLLLFAIPHGSSLARTVGLGAALLSLAACRAPEVCEKLGTCGGDVVGSVDHDGNGIPDKTWDIAGSCTNQVSGDPPNNSLIGQPTTPAGQRPPQPEYVNWCSELVLDSTKKITKAIPWYPALPIKSGSLSYSGDGSFSAQIEYSSPQTTAFAASCFTSQGFTVVPAGSTSTVNTMTCSEFGNLLQAFYADEPNITDNACGDDGEGGCACIYNLRIFTGVTGTFTVEGSVIHHYDKTAKLPDSPADFCVVQDQLQLSGHDRQFLFNQQHVRSLVLSGEP